MRGDAAEIQRSEQFDFCHVPRRIRQLDAGLPVLCSLKSIGDLSRGAMTPVHPESELDALGLDRASVHEDQSIIVGRIAHLIDQRAQAVPEGGSRQLYAPADQTLRDQLERLDALRLEVGIRLELVALEILLKFVGRSKGAATEQLDGGGAVWSVDQYQARTDRRV